MPSFVLRYFPVRGRVHALRLFLADQGFDWTNELVPMADWAAVKGDVTKSGHFATLPTLTVTGDDGSSFTFNEMVAIIAYLSKQQRSVTLSDEQWAHTLEVAMKAHLDLTIAICTAMYNPHFFPGTPVEKMATNVCKGVASILPRLETLFSDGRAFCVATTEPTIGDYCLFDALHRYT